MENPLSEIPHVKVTWRLGLELAVAALAIFLFVNWLGARDARVKAEAAQQAGERVVAQNQQQLKANADQVKALQDQLDQLKADQARQLATVQATFARAQTPADLSALVSQLMNLQKPITLVTPAPTPENPHPPPVAQVSTEDTPQVKAYVQACEECKVKLPNLQAQLDNTAKQLASANGDKQLLASSLVERTQERDRWQTAAKGGSFWERSKRAGKWGLIGGGVTIVVLCATGHCPK